MDKKLEDVATPLSDVIASLREELEVAAARQRERVQAAVESKRELIVPPFKLNEITLEVTIVTEKSGKGDGKVRFLVFEGGLEGGLSMEHTQRVTLKFDLSGKELYVGDPDEPDALDAPE